MISSKNYKLEISIKRCLERAKLDRIALPKKNWINCCWKEALEVSKQRAASFALLVNWVGRLWKGLERPMSINLMLRLRLHFYWRRRIYREWVNDLNSVSLPSNGGRSSKLLNTICNHHSDVYKPIFHRKVRFSEKKRRKILEVCIRPNVLWMEWPLVFSVSFINESCKQGSFYYKDSFYSAFIYFLIEHIPEKMKWHLLFFFQIGILSRFLLSVINKD